jgi:hypothetical protein
MNVSASQHKIEVAPRNKKAKRKKNLPEGRQVSIVGPINNYELVTEYYEWVTEYYELATEYKDQPKNRGRNFSGFYDDFKRKSRNGAGNYLNFTNMNVRILVHLFIEI